MSKTVDVTANIGGVCFAPATELEEILQNVRTILTTKKYTVPLDRGFGMNAELLDAPLPYAEGMLTAEIIETVEKYEPRVKVTKVTYTGDGEAGRLVPSVRVVIE
ncbi:MAG: GPW/gp25 family protein [Acidaminococcaceae bacterium]